MDRARTHLGALVAVCVLASCAWAQPAAFGPELPAELSEPTPQPAATPQADPPAQRADQPLGVLEPIAATEAQPLAGQAEAMPSVWRTLIPLAGVVGVILLLAALVRRSARGSGGLLGAMGPGGRAPSGVLSVLGRYPVGGGCQFVLLKVDRRVLLLSQQTGWRSRSKGSGFAVLTELTDPEEVASILVKTQDDKGTSIARRFGEYLQDQAPPADLVDLTARRVERSAGGDVVELGAASPPPGESISHRASALGSLRERLGRLRGQAEWEDSP